MLRASENHFRGCSRQTRRISPMRSGPRCGPWAQPTRTDAASPVACVGCDVAQLVPASQRNAAGIEKRAVLLGMDRKFELWSEQAHLDKIRQTIGEADLSSEMLDLRL